MIAIIWLAGEKRPAGEPRRKTVPCQPVLASNFPMSLWWNKHGRRHQHCRVVARGTMDSIEIEFEDGFRMITGRYAVRAL